MFVRIIVSGGFHNVEEKEFFAFETDSGLWLRPTTASKMQRYACGISDCCCGGLDRCRITDKQGNTLCVTNRYASGLPEMLDRIQDLVD